MCNIIFGTESWNYFYIQVYYICVPLTLDIKTISIYYMIPKSIKEVLYKYKYKYIYIYRIQIELSI